MIEPRLLKLEAIDEPEIDAAQAPVVSKPFRQKLEKIRDTLLHNNQTTDGARPAISDVVVAR